MGESAAQALASTLLQAHCALLRVSSVGSSGRKVWIREVSASRLKRDPDELQEQTLVTFTWRL